ncbi:MAG: hypothetical protein Q9166_002383 [cf. Caloplaca sp. 2 TL-2023]
MQFYLRKFFGHVADADPVEKAGHDVSGSYDGIIDLLKEVKAFTTRLNVHQSIMPELREISANIMVSVISICELSARAIRDGRLQAYFKAVILGMDENVQSELANLRRLVESEGKMVGPLTLSVANTTSYAVNEIRYQLSTMAVFAKDDIKRYVSKSLAKFRLFKRVSKGLRQEIPAKVIQGADGMFLWVHIMIKEIAANHTVEDIRQTLAKPPKGLSNTICHVFERFSNELSEEEITIFNDMLAWTVCAERRLTLEELDAVMKLKSSDGNGLIHLEGLSALVL